MTILLALWTRFRGYLVAIGAFVALLGAAWFKGRAAGAQAEKEARERHLAEARTIKRKQDNEIDQLGPADVDKRFTRWVRPTDNR